MHGSDKNSAFFMPQEPPFNPIIQVEDVSKSFGQIEAVSEVSFRVQEGSIFGLVGSDGSGKTTLLRMAAAMIKPSRGKIILDGNDVTKERTKIKGLIGYMPQRFGLYSDLTVNENLDFFMDIFGIFGAEREKRRKQFLGFSNLLGFKERLARDLSGGMKQKLGLACVLVHQPKILILDEPTNGVDPVSRQEFWEILGEMKGLGMTIMISTAYLDEGEKCDRLVLMHSSRVISEAAPGEIQSHFDSLEEAMIHRIKEIEGKSVNDGRK